MQMIPDPLLFLWTERRHCCHCSTILWSPKELSNYYHHLSSHFTILWSIVPWLYSKHIWPQRGRRIKITRQNSMSRMSLKAQKLDFHTWKWNFWVEPPGHVTPLQNFPSKHFQASDGQSTKTQIIGGDNHASLQCVEELCFYINKKSVSFSIMSPSIRARENTLEMEYWVCPNERHALPH